MNGQVSYGLPRPGRALWALLITLGAGAVALALMAPAAGAPSAGNIGVVAFHTLTCRVNDVLHGQVWRLLTSGLLTPPGDLFSLLLDLVGVYFLGSSLERRWGGRRLLTFVATSIVAGNVLAILVGFAAELAGVSGSLLHPTEMFGSSAMLTAITVAWAREFPDGMIRVYFVIPIRGKYILWLTVGMCLFVLVRGTPPPEGVAALFGGILTGLALSGSPSFLRRLWLRARLAVLQRRSSAIDTSDLLEPSPKAAPRRPRPPGAPPLRVLQGGLEDVLRKRKPPKDKRYLN